MLLEKSFDGSKATMRRIAPTVPRNTPREIEKRYAQMNAVFPGWNRGPSVEVFYDSMLQGQLAITTDGKLAYEDPLLRKDSPLTNADTGAFNAIYGGAQAIIQVAQNSNAMNSLPQTVWPQSGFRLVSSAAVSSGCGVAFSSDRPATIEPTYLEVAVGPKECAISTELSDVLVIQGETDDAVTFSLNKEVVESNVLNSWDADLLVDGNTLAGNNFESIDRLTASYATSTNLSWTTGDEDWHGVDRSGASYFDSTSYDNSGTDRYLTRSHLDTALTAVLPYVKSGYQDAIHLITGYTTLPSLWSLEEAKQFITTEKISIGVNGVQTMKGVDGGVTTSAYKGMPIIPDYNVQADTIERIYGINKDYAGLVMGRPMEFLVSDDPLRVGFNKLGLWHWIGELWGTKPVSSFSIRDLK